jgi:hypothetical protein
MTLILQANSNTFFSKCLVNNYKIYEMLKNRI